MRTLADSINVAFAPGSNSRGYLTDYLAEIRTNWREAEKDLRRTAGLLIVVAAVFQLAASKEGVSEVVLGFVKITDLELVRKVIPVIVAYLFYSMTMLMSDIDLFAQTHRRVVCVIYPSLRQTHLEAILDPPNSFFTGFGRRKNFVRSAGLQVGLLASFWLKLWIALLAPILFQGYACYVLINKFGFGSKDLLVTGSCILAVLIMLGALVLLVAIRNSQTGSEECPPSNQSTGETLVASPEELAT